MSKKVRKQAQHEGTGPTSKKNVFEGANTLEVPCSQLRFDPNKAVGCDTEIFHTQVSRTTSHLKYGVYILVAHDTGERVSHLVSAHSHFEDAQLAQGGTLSFSQKELLSTFGFNDEDYIESVLVLPL